MSAYLQLRILILDQNCGIIMEMGQKSYGGEGGKVLISFKNFLQGKSFLIFRHVPVSYTHLRAPRDS